MSGPVINPSTSLPSYPHSHSGSGSGSGLGSGSGGPPAASPTTAWRASKGRHDLSHRRLALLREMLNNPEAVFSADYGGGFPTSVPEEMNVHLPLGAILTETLKVNREWR
ncbi:hypothetical protein AN958_06508 [Leucoagaricus sp. SymC.cos]|nr:hypothetical protein AN958_06508 [Leucoagaricus sp. SymC.cos]